MRLGALMVLALIACGCGTTETVTVTVTQTTTVQETVTEAATPQPLDEPPTAEAFLGLPYCMVYNTSANIRVRAAAENISGVCESLARELSAGGDYWTTAPQALDTIAGNEQLVTVCLAADPTGVLELEVLDTGGLMRGTNICSNLIAKGWFDLG